MQWHIDAELLCVLFLTILYYSIRREFKRGAGADQMFLDCILAGILAMALDIAYCLAIDFRWSPLPFYAVATAYCILNALPFVAWFRYLVALVYPHNPRVARRALLLIALPAAAYAVLSVANLAGGFLFSVSPDSGYLRGSLYWTSYLLQGLYDLAFVLFVLIKWKAITPPSLRKLLLILPMGMAVGTIVQLSVPNWLTIYPAYTLALLTAYLMLQTGHTQKLLLDVQSIVRQLSDEASLDAMTNVFNRSAAMKLMTNALESDPVSCMLLMVDLDDLKTINDTWGHAEGDRALRTLAAQLKAHFRSTDIIGRVGGDEFLVFLRNTGDPEAIYRKITAMQQSVRATRLGQEELPLQCSVGCALGTGGRDDLITLYRQADAALYHVKRNGKNSYAVYTPRMSPLIKEASDPDPF